MSDGGTETAADDEPDSEGSEEQPQAANPEEGEEPEPAAQPAALRRQQIVVGTGVATLAGIAVTIAGLQQFPEFPLYLFVLLGMATTALLFVFLYANIFPGESNGE